MVAIAKLLLAHGADPTIRTPYGISAIDVARESGNTEIHALLRGHAR